MQDPFDLSLDLQDDAKMPSNIISECIDPKITNHSWSKLHYFSQVQLAQVYHVMESNIHRYISNVYNS